jgi:hypothetical protein
VKYSPNWKLRLKSALGRALRAPGHLTDADPDKTRLSVGAKGRKRERRAQTWVWGVYTPPPPQGPSYLRPKLVGGGGYGNFFHVVKKFSEKPATFFFFARRRQNFWEVATPPAGGHYPPPPPNGKSVPMSGRAIPRARPLTPPCTLREARLIWVSARQMTRGALFRHSFQSRLYFDYALPLS